MRRQYDNTPSVVISRRTASKVVPNQVKPLRQMVKQLQNGNSFGIVRLPVDYDEETGPDDKPSNFNVSAFAPVDPLIDLQFVKENVENIFEAVHEGNALIEKQKAEKEKQEKEKAEKEKFDKAVEDAVKAKTSK